MSKHAYVLEANLVGVPGVRRTIAVRSDQTLVDVHDALQLAFGWDDDHLYSFWLDGKFWSRNGDEYTHTFHAAQPNPFGAFATGHAPRSAETRLDRLEFSRGQRIAYLFDFGDEWRVRLTVSQFTPADGRSYPRLLESIGDSPPQYPDYEDVEEVA